MAKTRTLNPAAANTLEPLESVFDDLRVLLEARRNEYQGAADRISEILQTLAPKPRVGRPPKNRG